MVLDFFRSYLMQDKSYVLVLYRVCYQIFKIEFQGVLQLYFNCQSMTCVRILETMAYG